LVLIAVFLAIIALKPILKTQSAMAIPEGKMDYVQIWCSSCTFPGLPHEGHLILFDSRNGDIWAYSDKAVTGISKPVYLGKLKELGQPIMK
jgi:hypothetical protein